jgi:hypothetical protein
VLVLAIMKRTLKIVAGVVLLLLGLAFTVRAVMGTAFACTPIGGLINLPFLIPGVCMIIMAVVLLRLARN